MAILAAIFIFPYACPSMRVVEAVAAYLRGHVGILSLQSYCNNGHPASRHNLAKHILRIVNDGLSIMNSENHADNTIHYHQQSLRILQSSVAIINYCMGENDVLEPFSENKKAVLQLLIIAEMFAALSAAGSLGDNLTHAHQHQKVYQTIISLAQCLSELLLEKDWGVMAYFDLLLLLVASLDAALQQQGPIRLPEKQESKGGLDTQEVDALKNQLMKQEAAQLAEERQQKEEATGQIEQLKKELLEREQRWQAERIRLEQQLAEERRQREEAWGKRDEEMRARQASAEKIEEEIREICDDLRAHGCDV